MRRRRPLGPVLVLLVTLALLVPTAGTLAYFTSQDSAEPTNAGAGRWCSVPTPEEHSNVYRLSDMPHYDDFGSQMIIVPVVNNVEFEPIEDSTGSGRLGARLWACNTDALTSSSNIKITAWRNRTSENLVWLPPAGDGVAGQRLDPTEGFGGQEVSRLHRDGSRGVSGARLGGEARGIYTWLVSSGRNQLDRAGVAPCTGGVTACPYVGITPNATFADAFSSDGQDLREASNSVSYPGRNFYDFRPVSGPRVRDTTLSSYQGDLASQDRQQVQWVVMEWWGATQPTEDMAVEIFVE